MTKPPVVDILFRAILTGDQAALGDLETHRAAECTDLRALISTDQAGAMALDLELGATSSIYVTPFHVSPYKHASTTHGRANNGAPRLLVEL